MVELHPVSQREDAIVPKFGDTLKATVALCLRLLRTEEFFYSYSSHTYRGVFVEQYCANISATDKNFILQIHIQYMPLNISNGKSNFEITNFYVNPGKLNFNIASLVNNLNQLIYFSADDIRDLSGAPANSNIYAQNITLWTNQGSDKPPPGLYFSVSHPTLIDGHNKIGLYWIKGKGYQVYIKDIQFKSAPPGVAAIAFAKIVRFCLKYNIKKIRLLAAGGRLWPDMEDSQGNSIGRWGGYYFWARCGFDMPLLPEDLAILPRFPYHPINISSCQTVADVVKPKGGLEWWKTCGNGLFMEFDSSSDQTSSVLALEQYLAEKGV